MTVEQTPQYAEGYARGLTGLSTTQVHPAYVEGHAAGYAVWLRTAVSRLVGVVQ